MVNLRHIRLKENKGCQLLCDSRVKLIYLSVRFFLIHSLYFSKIQCPVISQHCNLCLILIKLKPDGINVLYGKHYSL